VIADTNYCSNYIPRKSLIDLVDRSMIFEVMDQGSNYSAYAGSDIGCFFCDCEWAII